MEGTLESYKQMFINIASGLKDYDKLNEYELVEGYCNMEDKGDSLKKNQYYAALMVKYWYKIYNYIESCKFTRLEDIDYIDWLADAFSIVFRYRSWRNSEKGISKDPKAVDKIINRCCFSVRGLHYQNLNKDKRKINYLCNSIEDQFEKFGNKSESTVGVYDQKSSIVDDLISYYLNRCDFLAAIIVDNIAYQDSFRSDKYSYYADDIIINEKEDEEEEETQLKKVKYTSYKYNFDVRKLVQNLTHLNDEYFNYFESKYIGDADYLLKFESEKLKLINIKSNKLYKYIDHVIDDLKTKVSRY